MFYGECYAYNYLDYMESLKKRLNEKNMLDDIDSFIFDKMNSSRKKILLLEKKYK